MNNYTLSAFGDEIDDDLETQLKLLNDLDVPGLELRAAWGTNVLKMTDDEVRRVRDLCAQYGITVQCIGSPIGKSPLDAPPETELANLERIIQVCEMLDVQRIRMFSFYPADISSNAHYDQYVDEVAERLAGMAELAQKAGVYLLHENEKEIVGDTPERCHKLVTAVNSPHLRLIWDPANYVQVGVANQVERYWDLLGDYTDYIHIKDAVLSDGRVVPAGEGDGQIPLLLAKLRATGYDGVLALEPHLKVAGHSGGHSGPDGMTTAVNALRKVIASVQ